jgi:hypothetical protein
MNTGYSYLTTKDIKKLIRTSQNLWNYWKGEAEVTKDKAWRGFCEGHACAYGDIVYMLKAELKRRRRNEKSRI